MKTKEIKNFYAIIEQDENGMYIGIVPSLRACYTQAKTLPELYKRLEEVILLSLEVEKELGLYTENTTTFVGFQHIPITV